MRGVTLLPAAMDIVAARGAASVLVGISHECDYPPEVQLPRVTTTPIDPATGGDSIDGEVRHSVIAESAGYSIQASQPAAQC